MFFMPRFANILLPLALEESLTYGVPSDLQLSVGQRVVVQLGKRKRYTGLVEKLHDEAPAEGVELKYIEEVVDGEPLLLPEQLRFWEWLANYYICTKARRTRRNQAVRFAVFEQAERHHKGRIFLGLHRFRRHFFHRNHFRRMYDFHTRSIVFVFCKLRLDLRFVARQNQAQLFIFV